MTAAAITLFITKLADSPFSFSATTTAFGYASAAEAERQIKTKSEWMRPTIEIHAVEFSQTQQTDDARVLMARGSDVLGTRLVKKVRGGALA